MRKFQCSLFVLKRSHICYYIICMTVPLNQYILNLTKDVTVYILVIHLYTIIYFDFFRFFSKKKKKKNS